MVTTCACHELSLIKLCVTVFDMKSHSLPSRMTGHHGQSVNDNPTLLMPAVVNLLLPFKLRNVFILVPVLKNR